MKLYKAAEIRDIPDGHYWYRWNEQKPQEWDVMSIKKKYHDEIALYFPYPNETFFREYDTIEERDDLIHYEFYGPIPLPEVS
jgi:hypothetical protein